MRLSENFWRAIFRCCPRVSAAGAYLLVVSSACSMQNPQPITWDLRESHLTSDAGWHKPSSRYNLQDFEDSVRRIEIHLPNDLIYRGNVRTIHMSRQEDQLQTISLHHPGMSFQEAIELSDEIGKVMQWTKRGMYLAEWQEEYSAKERSYGSREQCWRINQQSYCIKIASTFNRRQPFYVIFNIAFRDDLSRPVSKSFEAQPKQRETDKE